MSHLPPEGVAIGLLRKIAVGCHGRLKDDLGSARKILKSWRLDSGFRSDVRYPGGGVFVQWLPAKSLGQVISQFLGGHLIG